MVGGVAQKLGCRSMMACGLTGSTLDSDHLVGKLYTMDQPTKPIPTSIKITGLDTAAGQCQ